jgi:sec-independent protein translocase protein TatB
VEFLGIGYQEILLVFLLMLVFVGPERMPRVAYQIGRAVREMQKYARAVRDEFSDEIEFLETQYREVEAEMKDAQSSLRTETDRFGSEMRSATATVDDAVKGATRDLKAPPSTGSSNVVALSSARPADTPTTPATNGTEPPTQKTPGDAESSPAPVPAEPSPGPASDHGKKLVF